MFLTDFWKILRYQISQKSVQWELSCPMWMERVTEGTMLIVAFYNFANMPNKHTNRHWWEIQSAVTSRKNSSQFLSYELGLLGKVLIDLQGIIQLKPRTLPLSAIELLSDAELLPEYEVPSLHNVLLKAAPPSVPTESLSDFDKGIRSNINWKQRFIKAHKFYHI